MTSCCLWSLVVVRKLVAAAAAISSYFQWLAPPAGPVSGPVPPPQVGWKCQIPLVIDNA